MNEAIEQFKKLNKEYEEARKTLYKQGCALILDALKSEIFDKFPEVESVSWPQYTPYFNDGDPCEFCVYKDRWGIQCNGVDDDEIVGTEQEENKKFQEPRRIAASVLSNFPDEVFKIWGEGLVVINRKLDIELNDYRHD